MREANFKERGCRPVSAEEEADKLIKLQEQQKVVPLKNQINFMETTQGNIKANSIFNASLILEHDPVLKQLFAFNEFTHETEVTRDSRELLIEHGQLKDEYTPAIQAYMEAHYRVVFAPKLINDAVTNVSRKNVFNPVIEYFNNCFKKWDGKKRVADFLPTYLGADHSEVTTLQTMLFFVGAVAKTFKPETKFDFVLDLVGGQGTGKTTLLKNMANGWYTDQFTSFENKDDFGNMMRALIVNDDEMTATAHSSFEILKKFASLEKLEFRPAYRRNYVREYKNFVLARTTNELTYLKDKTGERRFLPIMVNPDQQEKSPVDELPQETIDQLWGEFVSYYRDGFSFKLTNEQALMLARNRENFMYIDEEEAQIEEALDQIKGDFVASAEIAFKMGVPDLVKNRKLSNKIKYVMDNKKGWKPAQPRINGTKRRGYKRVQ
ncbi:virulence-associated E family protein [Lactiplantibacillus plantarum]|nr:virulence-associated E family protein [Lactiplantibacillus plantarum]UNF77514.1 virulence-associated E family protein [Lactiplantibacillus plantarum]